MNLKKAFYCAIIAICTVAALASAHARAANQEGASMAFRYEQTVDLTTAGASPVGQLTGYAGDAKAHIWLVRVTRSGVAEDLTGYGATALQRRPGDTLEITGTITGNLVEIEFPAESYEYEGQGQLLLLRLTNNSLVKETIVAGVYLNVYASSSGLETAPGEHAIYALSDIIAQINACNAATAAAQTAVGLANFASANQLKSGLYKDQTFTVTEGYMWDPLTVAPYANATARYTSVPCAGGDMFRITTRGTPSVNRYAFVDSEGAVISYAAVDGAAVNRYDEEVSAPAGAATMYVSSSYLMTIQIRKLVQSTLAEAKAVVVIDRAVAASNALSTTSRRFIGDPVPAGALIKTVSFWAQVSSAATTIELWALNPATRVMTVVKSIAYTTVGTGVQTVDVYHRAASVMYVSFRNANSTVGYTAGVGRGYYISDVSSTTLGFSALNAEALSLHASLSYYVDTSALSLAKSVKGGILTVGPDGDYQTIQAACDAAPSKGVILIHSGTYREQIDITGKELHLVGVNRRTCIIVDSSSDYRTPPIEANMGSVRNLTIIEDAASPDPAIDGLIVDGHPVKNMAYCIHADSGRGILGAEDVYLTIEDCNLVNANRPCVGAGTYVKQHIRLINCDLQSGAGVVDGYKRGALYFHNNPNNGIANQSFEVHNCRIKCDDEIALFAGDTGATGGTFTAEFTNTQFYSAINGKANTAIFSQLGTADAEFKLSSASYGNSVAALNP